MPSKNTNTGLTPEIIAAITAAVQQATGTPASKPTPDGGEKTANTAVVGDIGRDEEDNIIIPVEFTITPGVGYLSKPGKSIIRCRLNETVMIPGVGRVKLLGNALELL